MKKIAFAQLSEAVRRFLAQVRPGEGMMVEDEAGRPRYGVLPYVEASPEEQARAWQRIEKLQRKVGRSLKRQDITSTDVENLLSDK